MKRINFADICLNIWVILFSLFCTVPMLLLVIVSFTDEASISKNGYSFIPEKLSIDAYKLVFSDNSSVLNSYAVTIFVTVTGTLAAVLITGMAAYTLSNKQVRHRNRLALYFFITMIFNAGIVPWYLLSVGLGFKDNLLALIIPGLIFNPFNLFLARNFMNEIPNEIRESATIDGANDIHIAFRLYFPLSVPVLAAITLFYGLEYWNNWYNAIMLVNNKKLFPLQYLLFKLVSEAKMLEELQKLGITDSAAGVYPSDSLKMATAVVTVGPIIFLYPYLQKYFVKGLIIGAVKG